LLKGDEGGFFILTPSYKISPCPSFTLKGTREKRGIVKSQHANLLIRIPDFL
jgi:hypothetical protein